MQLTYSPINSFKYWFSIESLITVYYPMTLTLIDPCPKVAHNLDLYTEQHKKRVRDFFSETILLNSIFYNIEKGRLTMMAVKMPAISDLTIFSQLLKILLHLIMIVSIMLHLF